MQITVLSRSDIERAVPLLDAVSAIEQAFIDHAERKAKMPPKVYLDVPEFGGDFRAMPAASGKYAGIKWVNSHPDNPKKFSLPTVMATYVLNDIASARPLAILDGTIITAMRTGAAAAVATKHLAAPRRPVLSMAVVGCGVQAEYIVRAHRAVYPGLSLFVNDVSEQRAEDFAKRYDAVAVPKEKLREVDVVCLATPGRDIALFRKDVEAGIHINAMGADAPGKREIEASFFDASLFLVVDDWEQASHSGEINLPVKQGLVARADIRGSLGAFVAGHEKVPTEASVTTLFDSTGLAIQDLALASAAYEASAELGLGAEVEL